MKHMKQFLLKLYFTDFDEIPKTNISTHICIDIYANNIEHAQALAKRLQKIHDADHYEVLK